MQLSVQPGGGEGGGGGLDGGAGGGEFGEHGPNSVHHQTTPAQRVSSLFASDIAVPCRVERELTHGEGGTQGWVAGARV